MMFFNTKDVPQTGPEPIAPFGGRRGFAVVGQASSVQEALLVGERGLGALEIPPTYENYRCRLNPAASPLGPVY
jgi:hypothetical protein